MSERVTDEELAEVERRAREATPGEGIAVAPYAADRDARWTVYVGGEAVARINASGISGRSEADARRFALACSILPRACRELRALRASVNGVDLEAHALASAVLDAVDADPRTSTEGRYDRVLDVLHPRVLAHASLTREAEELRAEVAQRTAERDEARDIKRKAVHKLNDRVANLEADLDAARAKIEQIAKVAAAASRAQGVDPDSP